MPRKARQPSSSGVYHIMVRGIDKMRIFQADDDNLQYLAFLDFVRNENFAVLGYCLMGNHVHLLVKTDKDSAAALESTMKKLGIRYAGFFNHKYQRVGALFQGWFVSQPVTTVSYFLRVLRYIHQNPVEAGMVEHPGDYSFSSYRDYFGGCKNRLCHVHTEYALQLRPLDRLRDWHEQPEHNAKGIADIDKTHTRLRLKDSEVVCLINTLAGCGPTDIKDLSENKKENLFHSLYREEGATIAQLSRITGISRGEIKRILMENRA